MEDNYTDKKTVDQAWASMRHLLDKEMPIDERKPFVPVWCYALCAAALVALGLHLMRTIDVPEPNQKYNIRHVDDQIAAQENTLSEDKLASKNITSKSNKNRNTNINTKSADLNKANHPNTIDANLLIAEVQPKNVFKSKSAGSVETVKIEKPVLLSNVGMSFQVKEVLPAIQNTPGNDQEVIISKELVYKSNGISITRDKVQDEQWESKFTVDRLPFLPLSTVQGLTSTSDFSASIQATKIKKRNWSVRLYGLQQLGKKIRSERNFNNISGASATNRFLSIEKNWGIEVLYARAFSSRWTASMGLGFKRNGDSIFEGNLLRWGATAFDPSNNGDPAFSGDVLRSTIPMTYFITLAFSVERKIFNRWSIEAGARYNQKVGISDSIFGELTRSNVDFFLTPSFHLSKRWSLGLTLQHSTNQLNHKKTGDIKELGRNQIGISTRYTL